MQGSHRLQKYFNIQDCLEKSLKIKFSLKSTSKTLKGLEMSLKFTGGFNTVFGDLNQYKIVMPYLVQHMLHQIKATQFYTK